QRCNLTLNGDACCRSVPLPQAGGAATPHRSAVSRVPHSAHPLNPASRRLATAGNAGIEHLPPVALAMHAYLEQLPRERRGFRAVASTRTLPLSGRIRAQLSYKFGPPIY